jgi:cell division protein FtsZ
MASSKKDRASMREGPLAALFRKTDEAIEGETARPADAPGAGPAPPAPGAPAAPPPATAAGGRESAPEPRAYPHPSLGASAPAPDAPEPEAPTPADRLRGAFSGPDAAPAPAPAVVAPREAPAPPPQRVYESDPFARHDAPTPWGAARPVGQPVIRVVGVGGAGVNAVNRMVEAAVEGVEFIAINTDVQSLQQSAADITLHIGPGITRGLGAGSNPELGRASAMEEYDKIKALLKGADMVFIAAGAGRRNGHGCGAGRRAHRPRARSADRRDHHEAVRLRGRPPRGAGRRGHRGAGEEVDTLIVVPNNRLLSVLDKKTSMVDAFRVADDVLRQGVQGISDLVTLPGLINLDFADVRTIMSDAGNALLGIGMGWGEGRAVDAARHAVESPLLETSMEGARKILLSITSGEDLSLWEVNEAAKAVAEAAHPTRTSSSARWSTSAWTTRCG